MKKLGLVLCCLLLIVGVLGCGEKKNEEIKKLNETSEYAKIEEYTKYLKEVDYKRISNVTLYCDEMEDSYLVTVENNTDYYLYCDYTLTDASGKEFDFEVFMARANRNDYYSRNFESEPIKYIEDKYTFFEFSYPNVDYEYVVEDNWDDESSWEDILIDPEALNEETITVLAKRMYAECVISDMWYETYYVYDENVEKLVDDAGEEYCDYSTAQYGFVVDLDENSIILYGNTGEQFEEINTITMD